MSFRKAFIKSQRTLEMVFSQLGDLPDIKFLPGAGGVSSADFVPRTEVAAAEADLTTSTGMALWVSTFTVSLPSTTAEMPRGHGRPLLLDHNPSVSPYR